MTNPSISSTPGPILHPDIFPLSARPEFVARPLEGVSATREQLRAHFDFGELDQVLRESYRSARQQKQLSVDSLPVRERQTDGR